MGLFCLTHMFVFPEGAPHSCPYCEVEHLRAALGPLAREADNWTDDVDGDTRILFTLELCRKARSALQSR